MNAMITKKGHQVVCHDCWRSRVSGNVHRQQLSTTERIAATLGPACGLPDVEPVFPPQSHRAHRVFRRLLLNSNSGLGITGQASRRNRADLAGASFGGQSVVSKAWEAYSAQGIGSNRKFPS